ncbi:MAG TPA: pilus assembly protein PilB, partial [Phycisphaerae bacterium]|nr:pilus assembly protein PilB [Phycisphaerae bacterium]
MAKTYDVNQLRGRPIGRILVKMGKITREQVHEALGAQKQRGGPLGQILSDLGYVDSATVGLALGFQIGMEYVDLDDIEIPDDVLKQVSSQMANSYKLIPVEFKQSDNHLVIAIASADNFHATDDLRTLMSYDVTAKIADESKIENLLVKHYGTEHESMGELINEIATDGQLTMLKDRGESIDLDTVMEVADSNPVKRLVNMVLLEAIRNRASDIHFEPFENEFKVRYRIDGHLYEMLPPPKSIALAIASRIKVMANLDIAERRVPQDGRIELLVNGQPVDLRISV